MDGITSKILEGLMQALKPAQVCWLCILVSIGAAGYGLKTFARNDDFTRFVRRQTEESIISNWRSQCTATGEAKRLYQDRVSQLQGEYEEHAGKRLTLPACEDIR